MTTCLILAAGNAERHNGGNKPFLVVNGETLLDRTSRQLKEMDQCALIWLVAKRDFEYHPLPRYAPLSSRWVTETLLSTKSAWATHGCTIVCLGDVFYTQHAMNRMFDPNWTAVAFGNGCNIHALRWAPRNSSQMELGLKKSVEAAEKHPHSYGVGKLWTFVAALEPAIPVIDFGDETTDFDSPQEHQRFIAKYGNRSTHSTGKAD